MAEYHHFPIYAKEAKDVPDWMKPSQADWQNAVPLETLQKHQLEVKMCCEKCEEIVVEKIREVHGVFDVRAEHFNSKVVVVSMPQPYNLNEHQVLRRARKVDKKAKFVELDAKERPKTDEQKKNDAEEAKKKKEAEEKKKEAEEKKKEEEEMRKKEKVEEMRKKEQGATLSSGFMWRPHWDGPCYAPQSYPMRPLHRYEAGSSQAPPPPPPFLHECDEFSRLVS